jgi:hypothetical protein
MLVVQALTGEQVLVVVVQEVLVPTLLLRERNKVARVALAQITPSAAHRPIMGLAEPAVDLLQVWVGQVWAVMVEVMQVRLQQWALPIQVQAVAVVWEPVAAMVPLERQGAQGLLSFVTWVRMRALEALKPQGLALQQAIACIPLQRRVLAH